MQTLLRADDVAERLNLRLARIYELVRQGRLPAVRIGRQVRFDPSQLEAFIRAGGDTESMVSSR